LLSLVPPAPGQRDMFRGSRGSPFGAIRQFAADLCALAILRVRRSVAFAGDTVILCRSCPMDSATRERPTAT